MNRNRILISSVVLLLSLTTGGFGTEFFVAGDGDDSYPGTSLDKPFRTISQAARMLRAGDSCSIRGGVYRESISLSYSGQQNEPITFTAYQNERVIVDGSDLITTPWSVDEYGVWKAKVATPDPIEAVFCDGRMMVEARWPNCSWEENWNAERKWASTGVGSTLGMIECPELGNSNLDLSGGLLYIRLSKGNNCFTRPISPHRAGSSRIEYDQTGIEGRAWNEDSMPERIKKFGFEKNRFFAVARGALDAPGEWWHDPGRSELFFIAPDGRAPIEHEVSIKSRVAGFAGDQVSHITLQGLEFRGCNIRFENCHAIVVRDCRFSYPTTPKVFPDAATTGQMQRNLRVAGSDNVLERLLIEWAVDTALEVEGSGNRIEDCIVHDSNLHGRHPGPAISVRGGLFEQKRAALKPNVIRRCTAFNLGGVGLYIHGTGPATAEFNHIFNAGLYCVDVSSLYIPVGRDMAGSLVHHNWLHDISGIGFRVDIQGRGITVHHNLVWNASVGCKLQGYHLSAYNNTVLSSNSAGGFIVVFEPDASLEERAEWRIRNNVSYAFNDRLSLRNDPRKSERPFLLPLSTEVGAIDHNLVVPADHSQLFVDMNGFDFRPKLGGPLDGTGVTLEGIAAGASGKPPAIGALDVLDRAWQAGASWMHDGLPVPESPAEATELARQLRPAWIELGTANQHYEAQ